MAFNVPAGGGPPPPHDPRPSFEAVLDHKTGLVHCTDKALLQHMQQSLLYLLNLIKGVHEHSFQIKELKVRLVIKISSLTDKLLCCVSKSGEVSADSAQLWPLVGELQQLSNDTYTLLGTRVITRL